MLLTIHNLPPRMRYGDVKSLIVSKCGFKDIILDNLINEGRGTKQVTVGLAAEEDAAMLVRQINGLYVEGKQLYVEDVRQKNQSQQPYRQTQDESSYSGSQRGTNQSSSYTAPGNGPQPYSGQQMYMNQMPGFPGQSDPMTMPMMPFMGGMGGMMFVPPGQNSYMDYAGQTQQLPLSATQYTPMSGEQAQTGSGSGYHNYTDDKWSRDRRAQQGTSQENRNQSSYKSDSRQQFRDNNTSRRRSRSPRDNRDRSRGSPKRGRYDEGDFRSQSNRDSQRYTPDRAETYTSQNYDRSQKQPSFKNDPVTSNKPPLLSTPAQNRWNSGQQFNHDSSGDRSQNWNKNQTSSNDEKSNYRKHMESKQNQSKGVWKNPMQTSWGRQDAATSREEIQSQPSQFKWTNPNKGKGQTNSGGPVEQRQSLLGNPPQRSWEPNKNAPKPSNVTNYPKQKPAKSKKNKGKKKGVMPTLKDDSILRYRAAGQIANEIAKEHINIISKEFYLKNLRKSVRSRLEVLLDANIGMPLDQMIKTYRMTFPSYTDRDYCKAVVEQIPADVRAKIEATGENVDVAKLNINKPTASNNQPAANKNQPAANKNQPKANKKPAANKNQSAVSITQPGTFQPLMNLPVLTNLKPPNPSEKLPKYPQGDKQIYKEQKKLKKLEHGKEDIYSLPQPMQRVLDEELQALVDIYKSIVKTADNEKEQALCDRFSTIGVDITRKVLKLNVTKRLLCINTNLVVRVYINGKPPKKLEVEEFMRKNGAVSCKKSVKRAPIYVATCRDFAAFDRLCGMGTVPMNAETALVIKPFQLAGPKLSFKERKELRERRLLGLEGSSEPTPDIPEEDDFTNDSLNPIGRFEGTGQFEDPGEAENPGEIEDPEQFDDPGETEDPGEIEDPEQFDDPGETEDPGQSEDPEQLDDPGETEDPGQSQDPEETEEPGQLVQDSENDTNDASQNAGIDDMELNDEDFEDY